MIKAELMIKGKPPRYVADVDATLCPVFFEDVAFTVDLLLVTRHRVSQKRLRIFVSVRTSSDFLYL